MIQEVTKIEVKEHSSEPKPKIRVEDSEEEDPEEIIESRPQVEALKEMTVHELWQQARRIKENDNLSE